MKFKEIKPGMVIHCPKEEDARALLEHLDELGYVWKDNASLLEPEGITYKWKYHQDGLFYNIAKEPDKLISWSSNPYGKTVTEFSDLIEKPEPRLKTKYQVGDKVRVKADIKDGTIYSNGLVFSGEMNSVVGQVVTIRDVLEMANTYRVEGFSDVWSWCDEMFEPINDSPINSDTDSPMTAAEVLEWLGIHYRDEEYTEVFGSDYKFTELLRPEFSSFTSQEIVDKITAYEAAKKAPKPVEVEEGYHCLIHVSDSSGRYSADEIIADYELWNVDKETAEDDVAVKARDRARAIKAQVWGELKFICRVKED